MVIMNYGLREKYEQLKKFGDRLSDMKDTIDWNRIEPLLSDLYKPIQKGVEGQTLIPYSW